MSSTLFASDPKDVPSLTVTVDTYSSASPFPSPGSSFIPPPVPGAHEYAIKSPTPRRKLSEAKLNGSANPDNANGASMISEKTEADETVSKAANQDSEQEIWVADALVEKLGTGPSKTPPFSKVLASVSEQIAGKEGAGTTATVSGEAVAAGGEEVQGGASNTTSSADSPTSVLTPIADNRSRATSTSLSEDSDTTPPSSAATPTMANSGIEREPSPPPEPTPLRSSRDSLTSSRPAPPSPAASRRASAAMSRTSGRSRPSSTLASTPGGSSSRLSLSGLDAQLAPETPKPPTHSLLVKIRDFAFPPSDARHTGTGPMTPHPNKRLQRPLSAWSSSSASSASSDHQTAEDDSQGGWSGAFGWAGLRRMSWFSGSREAGNTEAPSDGDFARNFAGESPSSEIEDPMDAQSDEYDEDDEEQEVERELPPGLYRALYAFEPEGTAEMALEEEQIVRVLGRGGGVGWAIVVREGGEGHALVPEGYLEPVRLDRDSDEDDEDEG
ncbi:hypothetical protein BV25DRAFT_1551998 [Artomyces pyxidatus]|uniref:Uncharacterized protein n=1 Tax=Artomyces pyxidatus TaxID=48021 RepID=A0ACB8SLB5_9AGAM|nr:hypothetical protein BV25DRAFT_1551998 [Artomyces pyxidatus]